MFNFNLMNNALTDTNISNSEFRTLYLIVNHCSLNKTVSVEMYNALIMAPLHYSESTVKRCIKALEEKGYISVKRATKKKQPNVITLIDIKNECRDETINAVKNEVRNDTLYNNIYNNKNIHSIRSNSNEDNGIPYNVYCEQQLAKEKEEMEKKASYNLLNLNEDNLIVGDNTNEVIHSTDIVNDNLNEDSEMDYEVYEEQQIAKEKISYDYINNFNVDNGDLQGIRGIDIVDNNSNEEIRGIQSIDTETDIPNEDNNIDATIEAYERGIIKAAEQSSIPQQQSNPNGIDWDAWRERFERCKIGMLNAKCKMDFDLWKGNCGKSLKFAKEHMRHEKYEKQRAIFEKWYAASEPHFNYKESKNTMQTNKHKKQFSKIEWDSIVNQIAELPIKEPLVKDAVEYLIDCGKDPNSFKEQMIKEFGIAI